MQTIVCQAAETFSPDISQQASLQKPRQSDSPRESGFLAMLNQSIQKESAAQETGSVSQSQQVSKAQEDGAPAQAQDTVEQKEAPKETKELSRADEPKKADKKETAKNGGEKAQKNGGSRAGSEKIDAFIAGALSSGEPKKVEAKPAAKSAKTSGGKTVAAEDGAKKIDPKQLEFLKKLSQVQEPQKENDAGQIKSLEGGMDQDFAAAILAQEESAAASQSNLDFAAFAQSSGDKIEQGQMDAASGKTAALTVKKDGKKSVIQVTDLRTKIEPQEAQKAGAKDARKNFTVSVKEAANGQVEMTLDLNGQQAQKNILSLDSQSAASDGSTFQAMLKNQIAQNAGDFAKAGNIVLRDNNQGQINLILHPEDLGNVKISVEMNGKSLVGHITVQSKEALEAFGQSADALKQAFIQSGFEDASFDVSYASSGMQFAQGQADDGSQERARQGKKIYGEFAQESLTSASGISDNFIDDDVSVNIVA